MNNPYTKEYIKAFIHDLMLAHLCPERECKNPLVKSFIKEFRQRQSINGFIKSAKLTCRQLPSSVLYQSIQEAENLVPEVLKHFNYNIWGSSAWPLEDEKIRRIVKSIGRDGAEWLCRWIQLSICSLQELLRRNGFELDGLNLRKKLRKQRGSKTSQQKKPRGKGSQIPFKTDSVLAALFQLNKKEDSLLKKEIVSPIEAALNIKMEERLGNKRDYGLLSEIENDIVLVCRGIKGIDEADYERVREIFYDILLIKNCDKKFANLSEVEIIDSIVKDDKDDKYWRYLSHRVWEDAMDELVPYYPRLRKIKDRFRRKGRSDDEFEQIKKRGGKPFFNFKNPHGLYREKKEDGLIIVEEYIAGSYDQLEIISYVETEEKIIKTLEDCKQTVFKNHPAGKALIDYIIQNLDNEEAKFTNREISEKTGYHEDVIGRMRKLLEKEVPIIRELLQ